MDGLKEKYTPVQSRAVAAWFSSAEFLALTIKQQYEIRDRAELGWSHLTKQERNKALSAASDRS